MKEIHIKELLGTQLTTEDAVIVKMVINQSLPDRIIPDFQDINNVPAGFFC